MQKKKKKSQAKLQKNPLELGLERQPNRERLAFLLHTSLSSVPMGKFGVHEIMRTGSMCPQRTGPSNNGGGDWGGGTWGCFLRKLDKETLDHQRVRGLQTEQKLKGTNEHGGVTGVLSTQRRPGVIGGPPAKSIER